MKDIIEKIDKGVFLEKVVKGFGRSMAFSKLHSGGELTAEERTFLQQNMRTIGIPENASYEEMREAARAIMSRAVAL